MAGGGLIGALRVTLGIDTAAFEAGAKRARATADESASGITKAFGGMKTAISGLLAGVSVGVIVEATKRALEYTSSLAEQSQQLGVTAKDLQEYRYAASQVGIAQEDMEKGLAKLTLTMGQARAGVDKPKAAFKELSDLLGKDVLKSAATAGDAIPLIADAMAKVSDPTRRAALEVELFGKTGQKLDNLLSGGSAAVNQLRDAAQDLGLVLSDEQIANADNTADKLSELQQVLEANIASAVANNVQSIYDLATALEHLVIWLGKTVGAWSNFNATGILDNPNQTAFVSWLRGQDNGKVVAGARQTLMATHDGRSELYERNKANRADLAAGNTARLGAQGTGILDNPAARAAEAKRLETERTEIVRAEVSARRKVARPKASAGAGAGDGKDKPEKTKKPKAASGPKIDPEKQEDRYQSEILRLEQEELRDRTSLADTTQERLDLANKGIDNDVAEYKASLDSQVLAKQITQAQANKLLAAKKGNANLERDIEQQRADDENTKAALSASDARLSLQSDLLKGDLGEAKTQAERRAIQLKLLDIEYDRQRNALQAAVDSHSTSPEDRKAAQDRLTALGSLKAKDVTGTVNSTMGPMEAFRDGLHRTAGQITEDFQQIEVDGIKSLNDGLIDAIMNSKSLGDVFSSVAKQIVADLLKIGLQAAESSLFGGKSGGGGGLISGLLGAIGLGSHTLGGSSISNSLFKGLSQGNGIKGLATGGTITVPNRAGVDTNLLSLNGMPAARVNSGETISVTPDGRRRSDAGTRYYDFRGVQSADIPRLEAMINKLDRSIEPRSVSAVADASDRRIIRR